MATKGVRGMSIWGIIGCIIGAICLIAFLIIICLVKMSSILSRQEEREEYENEKRKDIDRNP